MEIKRNIIYQVIIHVKGIILDKLQVLSETIITLDF